MSGALRLHAPVIALAALPLLLGLRFGGFHIRHAGWVFLALAIWACVQAARGRLSSVRSAGGIATFALLALTGWTVASISWADVSRHDAWVEGARMAGYAAAFILGGSLLANARSLARLATLTGAGIALITGAIAVRLVAADAPLQAFVYGRLDWPVGYAPGTAGLCLIGMLLLLGASCAAERAWELTRSGRQLAWSAVALGGAGLCGAGAMLAQSRGALPALAAAIVVALIAMPRRASWLLRLGAIAVALVAVRGRLGAPFSSQFDLRQAPFTEGADQAALLAAAEQAARDAGAAMLALLVVLGIVGLALVPVGAWLGEQIEAFEDRLGMSVLVPGVVGVVALVGALLVLTAGDDRSPTSWAKQQWEGCRNPPERVGDPGSGTSHFTNTGTGRCDYYRVALLGAREAPLLGVGAGNFRGVYVRERRTAEEPRVVHSQPLELLVGLGAVGAALGAIVFGTVAWAALRFVRSGPRRDATIAGAVVALGYWTVHASIDWLWQLPVTTLPALAIAGGLVACVSPAQGRVRGSVAGPFAAAAVLGSLALVLPVTMADARLREARDPQVQERDAKRALEAAREAQSFDSTWAEPAITEALLHYEADRRGDAAAAARRAVELEPGNWSVQYRASGLIGLTDSEAGRRAFLAARDLNPQLPASVDSRETPGPDALQNPDA